MATHDYVIANGTGAAVRSDLNDALAAIVSNNSGTSEPATTYAYQWWADTTANVLKIRNSANNAWITLRELDGTLLMEDGSASTPGLAFADDTNTGIFSGGADQVGLSTNGVERFNVGTGSVIINDPGNDVDFRVESNGNTHMLFVDAGNDRVGIGQVPTRELSLHSPDNNNSYIHFTNDDTGETASDGALVGIDGNEDLNINNQESSKNIILRTGGSERLRLDSDGRLLLGTAGGRAIGGGTQAIAQIETTSQNGLSFVAHRGTNTSGSILILGKSRGTSVGSSTIVADGDELGALRFAGADGSDVQSRGGEISCEVDGTPGSNDMPGRLIFKTSADGASSPTERMRIKSDGTLHAIKSGTQITNAEQTVAVFQRSSASGSTSKISIVSGNAASSQIQFGDTDDEDVGIIHYDHADNSMRFSTNTSEAMRLDSSGRLLIGTTSAREHLNDGSDSAQVFIQGTTQNTSTLAVIRSSDNDGPSHLVLGKARGTGSGSTTIVQDGDTIGSINFEAADGSHLIRAGQISCVVDGTPGANDMPGSLKFSTTVNGSNGLTQRMRITNQGRLDIFATSSTDTHFISSAGSAGTALEFIKCMHSAGSIGAGTTSFKVSTNGNVQNTNNSYGSISDVKLKENIADASSQWSDIKGLRVRNYNFKEETGNPTHTQIGVVAQEVETVSPGLVYETPDKDDDGTDLGTVTKSVNYSVLYMKAVKALQEAMDRIETLEAKVAALEAG